MNRKCQILVIDDDAPSLEVLERKFTEKGYDVQSAANGKEGLEKIKAKEFDLVLMDIRMPIMDGQTALKEIRTKFTAIHLPVIMVTAIETVEDVKKALKLGANDYLTKPYDFDVLSARVASQLALRRASLELSKANKMIALGEMAGGLAHEINNPLTVVLGKIKKLKNCLPDNQKEIDSIEDACWRISKIVKSFLIFSQQDLTEVSRPVSLKKIVTETLNLNQGYFEGNNINFECGQVPDVAIDCRSVQLGQALFTLIHNGYQAVADDKDGWVKLDFEDSSHAVKISITDSGKGIPNSIQDRIMEPFFSTKSVGDGSGLGLNVCKGVVESHGGTLTLDTQAPNTKFVVILPKSIKKNAA